MNTGKFTLVLGARETHRAGTLLWAMPKKFGVWCSWLGRLWFNLTRQSPPPGFKAPILTRLWGQIVKHRQFSRDSIKPKQDGTGPLDNLIANLPQVHTVVYFMLPTAPEKQETKAPKTAYQDPRQDWRHWATGSKTFSDKWKGTKQTNGKKCKGGGGTGKLPQAPRNCALSTPDEKRLSYAYQLPHWWFRHNQSWRNLWQRNICVCNEGVLWQSPTPCMYKK